MNKKVEPGQIADYIGKDAAEKLLKTVPESPDGFNGKAHILQGNDLKVGGEGMKGFYDKILVDYANKFGKKFGAQVGDRNLAGSLEDSAKIQSQHFESGESDYRVFTPEGSTLYRGPDEALAKTFVKEYNEGREVKTGDRVHSLPITPEMKDSVLREGVARFMPRVKNPKAKPPELSEFDDEKKIKAAFEKPNWAIVTGTRESDGPANSEKNQRANDRLEGELFGSGLDYRVIQGSYKGVDQGKSFLITGITPAESLKLGREYGQESVLVPQGLLYNDGTLNPIDSAKNKFGADAEKEDFYSKTEEGPAFSAGINFDKRIPTDLGTVNREQAEMFGRSSPKIGSEVVRAKGDKTVPYDFEGGPNLKAEKTPGDKVAAMADKIVAEVHAKENTPEFRDGLSWYSDFVPKLKNWFGEHSQIFAELLAATSPQTRVTANFGYAVKAYEGWLRGEYSDQLTKLNEGLSKVDDGSIKSWYKKVTPKETQIEDPTPSQYIGAWIDEHKLVPTQWGRETVNPITGKETPREVKFGLHGLPVLKVLARKWLDEHPGQKVTNFVKNLTGEGHEATIDVWAARLLRRLAYDTGKKPWRIAPAQEGGVNKPDFDFGQAAFRQAGKTLGIKPDALQAALWFAEKKLWAQNRWSKTLDLGDFRNELENFITRRKYQKAQGKLFGNEVVPLNKVQSKKGLGAEAIKAMPEATRELFDIHPKK